MKSNIFNKNRYFELLKSNNKLDNELLNYKVVLENSIIYHNRNKYINFLREHIDECTTSLDKTNLKENDLNHKSDSALASFFELYYKNVDDYDFLENKIMKEGITILDNFLIYSNTTEFSSWIDHVIYFGEDNDISLTEYKNSMEFALSNLQNLTNSNLSLTNLINQSYYLLFLTLLTLALICLIPIF